MNQDLSLLSNPSTLRGRLHSNLLQTGTQGSLCPQLSVRGLSVWEQQGFGTVAEAKSPVSAVEQWGFPASTLSPMCEMEALPCACCTKNTRAPTPSPQLIKQQRQAGKTLRCHSSSNEFSALRVGVTKRGVCHCPPPPSGSRTLDQRFCLWWGIRVRGKQGIKQIIPISV